MGSVTGALPDSLTIDVAFGGAQSESYRVGSSTRGEVVCCQSVEEVSDAPKRIPCAGAGLDKAEQFNLAARDASHILNDAGTMGSTSDGTPGADFDFVVCDLWTNGAAHLTVWIDGETRLDQTLPARQQEESGNCGLLQTVDAVLALGDSDAGVRIEQ